MFLMGGALGKRLTEGRSIVKGRSEGECSKGVGPRTPRLGAGKETPKYFTRSRFVRGRAQAV